MGWIQTKKLFLSKGYNQECEERAYRVGEKFLPRPLQREHLSPKFIKNLQNLAPKIQRTQSINGSRNWTDIFAEEDTQAINKYMKKCSTSLVIREM